MCYSPEFLQCVRCEKCGDSVLDVIPSILFDCECGCVTIYCYDCFFDHQTEIKMSLMLDESEFI